MYDTIEHNIDRNKSVLHEMAALGTEYRERVEMDLYGEEVVVYLKPMDDEKFLPMLSWFAEHFDYDDEEMEEYAAGDAIDEVEDVEDVDEINVEEMDGEFVQKMREAAAYGLAGTEDHEGNYVNLEGEENKEERIMLIKSLIGGQSVKLGSLALKVTGDARDADKFREFRRGVSDSHAE